MDPTTTDGYEFCAMQRGKCACDGEILMGRWNVIEMKLDRKEPDNGLYHAPGKGAEQVECNPQYIGSGIKDSYPGEDKICFCKPTNGKSEHNAKNQKAIQEYVGTLPSSSAAAAAAAADAIPAAHKIDSGGGTLPSAVEALSAYKKESTAVAAAAAVRKYLGEDEASADSSDGDNVRNARYDPASHEGKDIRVGGWLNM